VCQRRRVRLPGCVRVQGWVGGLRLPHPGVQTGLLRAGTEEPAIRAGRAGCAGAVWLDNAGAVRTMLCVVVCACVPRHLNVMHAVQVRMLAEASHHLGAPNHRRAEVPSLRPRPPQLLLTLHGRRLRLAEPACAPATVGAYALCNARHHLSVAGAHCAV